MLDSITPYIFNGELDAYDDYWSATNRKNNTYYGILPELFQREIMKNAFQHVKVGIVDERSEIAGCVNGIPQLTFGHRVDVLDACPKAEGMMMMIRSMSPDVLVVDEIGRKEDAEAIRKLYMPV